MSGAEFEFGGETYTSEELAEMDEDEREHLFAEKTAELDAVAEDALHTLEEDELEALEALEPDDVPTDTITFETGVTVDVKTRLPAATEDKIDRISRQDGSIAGVRSELIEVIADVIEDEKYGGEKGIRVWNAYAARNGTLGLFQIFETVTGPALGEMQGAGAAGNSQGPGAGN